MKSVFVTIAFIWLSLFMYAQQTVDSLQIVDLELVTICAVSSLINSFNDADTLKTNTIGIINSLQQKSNFYINTSSPNGLTTLSLNGIAAKSIPVTWQNHNLNNVMNGIIDVALLDNFLFNQLEVRYADSFEQAGWGGGGALIKLKDQLSSKVEIQHEIGSFSKQKIGVGYNWQHQKIKNTIKVFYTKAKNDFRILHHQLKKEKQENNEIKSWGVLNNIEFTANENHHFKVNLWLQNTDRQIATPLFISNNNSTQIDSTFRVNLTWQNEPLNLKASVAYFNELNVYDNPQIDILGIHKTIALKSYVTHHKKINKTFIVRNSISHNFYKANSTNFKNDKIRNSVQLKSVLLHQLENLPLKFKADVVVDYTDKNFLPVRPGIYTSYKINRNFKLDAQLSRHYSLPTFNDLYWTPGGNNKLLPESGYIANLSFTHSNNNQLIKLNLFNSSINNEIVWLPGTAYWSPKNFNRLRSKGFNVKAQHFFNINDKSKLNLTGNYIYTNVQNVANKPEENFQIIYRPKHKANLDLIYYFNEKITLNYNHQITSKRFTTTNNAVFVPAYNTANFSVKYNTNIDNAKLNVEANILNVFNAYYEVTANRPMPGTHFLLSTNLNF